MAYGNNDQWKSSRSSTLTSSFILVRMEAEIALKKKKKALPNLLFCSTNISSNYLRNFLISRKSHVGRKNTHFLQTCTMTVKLQWFHDSTILQLYMCIFLFSNKAILTREDLRLSHFRTIVTFSSSYDMPIFLICFLF